MKKNTIVLFLALALGMGVTDAEANVFASSVTVDFNGTFPATISYNLNQDATSVVITIRDYPGGNVVKTITIQAGDNGTFVGFNDVAWDGSLDGGGTATTGVFTIEIDAFDDVGSDGFELTSFDTGPDSWYWSSSGVAANTRQTSPDFGTAYVTERSGGTSTNTPSLETVRGLYLHDSFGRYLGFQQVSAYAEGNSVLDWTALSPDGSGAPFSATIGPDDRVYISVLPEGIDLPMTGGVAVGDALWSTSSVETILDFSGNAISDILVVGMGADRVLYTVEQLGAETGGDMDAADNADNFKSAEIKSYAIGETSGPFTGGGTVVIPTTTLSVPFSIEMDSDSYLYVVQQAYDSLARADNIYALSKWDISGSAPVEMWHVDLDEAPPNFGSFAPATSFNGVALDEPRGRVYVSRRNTDGKPLHNVIGYAMDTGAQLAGFSFSTSESIVGTDTTGLAGGGGNNIRDIAVDAAGNVLSANSSSETFRIHSPPDGPNNFNTLSPWAIDVDNGAVIPTPEEAPTGGSEFEVGEGFEMAWTLDPRDSPDLFPRGPAFGARSVLTGMDFDGDGNKEFLFTTDETLAPQGPDPGFLDVYLYENNGDNSYEYVWHYTHTVASNSLPALAWGDIDDDGLYEIYLGIPTINDDPDDLFIFEQNADLTFPSEPTVTWGFNRDGAADFRPSGFKIADVDGDGVKELITTSRKSGNRELVIATPNGGIDAFTTWTIEFEAGEDILGGGSIYDVDVFDFDNDGLMEVWVNTWDLFSYAVWEATGPDTYELVAEINQGFGEADHGQFNSHKFLWNDIDGDGRSELLVPTTEGVLFFLDDMDDISELTAESFVRVLSFLDPTASALESRGGDIGDIDGDGMTDIIISRGRGESVVRLEYNGGDPADSTSYDMSVVITEVDPETVIRFYPLRIADDLDGDGKKEIVMTNLFATTGGSAAAKASAGGAPMIVIVEVTGEATAIEDEPGIPSGYALSQNYPNPFNPSTTVVFEVPETAEVEVAVFDVTGRMVSMLSSGLINAGTHRVTFNGDELPSGVYMIRMQTPFGALTRKALLLK